MKRHVVPTNAARPRRGSVPARHRPRSRPASRRLRRPRSARTAARRPAAPPRLPSSGPASRACARRTDGAFLASSVMASGCRWFASNRRRTKRSREQRRKRRACLVFRTAFDEHINDRSVAAPPSSRSHTTPSILSSQKFKPPPAFPAPPRHPDRAPPRLSTPPPARTRRAHVCSLAKPPPRAPR